MRIHISILKITKSTKGQGIAEYSLIVGLIALVVISLLGSLGEKVGEFFSSFVDLLT